VGQDADTRRQLGAVGVTVEHGNTPTIAIAAAIGARADT
jgi:hypothetical protein